MNQRGQVEEAGKAKKKNDMDMRHINFFRPNSKSLKLQIHHIGPQAISEKDHRGALMGHNPSL